jgi:hypothetical protein
MSFKDKLRRLSPQPGATPRTLDELRERMQALTGTAMAHASAPSARGFEQFGLVRASNERGEFWQRRERFLASRRVGRSPVADARAAEAGVLSLLSLDSELAAVAPARALYLDTETTGLGSGAGTFPFLIGALYFEGDHTWFEQLMLAGPEQEAAALERVVELVARCGVLVTFNGKAFDWPLLETRFVYNRMKAPPKRPHLDLLHVARRVHKHRIGRCTLRDVEARVLGYERVGDIDGALVAAAYCHYLRSGDDSGLGQVLEHNTLDVASMAALVGLYGQPVPDVDVRDLPSVSRTYRKAKALDRAKDVADLAVQRGGGGLALRARAEVQKALGERLWALCDYEAADAELDDPDIRLELAKLYEHFQKDPARALAVIERGISESDAARERRSSRLERKLRGQKLQRPRRPDTPGRR